MKTKWKITLAIWIGIVLYFAFGSLLGKEVDMFLIALRLVLLLGAGAYTAFLWLRDLGRGETDNKTYHLSAYPRWMLKFIFDDPEDR